MRVLPVVLHYHVVFGDKNIDLIVSHVSRDELLVSRNGWKHAFQLEKNLRSDSRRVGQGAANASPASDTAVNDRFPFTPADRATPPDLLVASSRHGSSRKWAVLRRVPFRREIRVRCLQTIGLDNPQPAAHEATSATLRR